MQKNLIESVMWYLGKSGAADAVPSESEVVVTSDPIRKFLAGEEVIITDRE